MFGKTSAYLAAALVTALMLGSCQPVVLMTPTDDDLIVLNGCVVSACNYLAAMKTQHGLERNFWAKVLLVRYANHPSGHAYCVWETDGRIYSYDRNGGAFPIPVYTRDPKAIATVLADGLSKVLNQQLAVSNAEYVEPAKADLRTF